jgi:hypothetical protein
MSAAHRVFSCAACRKVRDEKGDGTDGHEWYTLGDFLKRHHRCTEDVMLSECYCPDCALSYDRLMQYGQTHNTAL